MGGSTKVKSGSSKGNNKRSSKPSTSGSTSKNKKHTSPRQAAKVSKPSKPSKPTTNASTPKKKGRKQYAEKDLNLPSLNMITPAGVQKLKGKKKGKVFVDDQESMMTILAMVNADKEGQIESKMMKARQMEEIRQARQREMDARADEKKKRLDETKAGLKKGRKRPGDNQSGEKEAVVDGGEERKAKKKRVSFG